MSEFPWNQSNLTPKITSSQVVSSYYFLSFLYQWFGSYYVWDTRFNALQSMKNKEAEACDWQFNSFRYPSFMFKLYGKVCLIGT